MRTLILLLLLAIPLRATAAPGELVCRAMEQQLYELVSETRKAAGVPPLQWNEALSAVARAHSRAMRDRNFFAHLDPEGRSPLDRILAAHIACTRAGENLALDREVMHPHAVMMAEPPNQPNHRANLLNAAYTAVGIGIVADGETLYITEDFITAGSADTPVWDRSNTNAASLNALTNRMASLQERLGRMALLAGDSPGAVKAFQEALRLDSRCAGAQAGLAEAWDRAGKLEEARAAYAAAIAADPDNLPARQRLADLLLDANQPAVAETHYLLLTRLQPENANAWYGAARCAAGRGQAESARERLRRAFALDASLRARARTVPALTLLLE